MRQEYLRYLSYFVKPPLTTSEPYAPNSGTSVALINWELLMTRVQSEEQNHNPGETSETRLFQSETLT